MADNVSIGFTSTDKHPSGDYMRVWDGIQTLNRIFEVNTFSYAYLATFAMPALARSGAAAKVSFIAMFATKFRQPGCEHCW